MSGARLITKDRLVGLLLLTSLSVPMLACCLGSRKWLPSDVEWSDISAETLRIDDFARTDVLPVPTCDGCSGAGDGPVEVTTPDYLVGRWSQDTRSRRTLEVVDHLDGYLSGNRASLGCAQGCPASLPSLRSICLLHADGSACLPPGSCGYAATP